MAPLMSATPPPGGDGGSVAGGWSSRVEAGLPPGRGPGMEVGGVPKSAAGSRPKPPGFLRFTQFGMGLCLALMALLATGPVQAAAARLLLACAAVGLMAAMWVLLGRRRGSRLWSRSPSRLR